ncbi:MAG: response regulator transcription factor [Burkholderiaceae bacterium]|nr:response regulator transcription factor [Burkholderiaceae bacterium]
MLGKTSAVLILDDDASVRRAYARVLVEEGYQVQEFQDFSALRRAVESGAAPTDRACLLLDMRMPGGDGLEVQRWISSGPRSLPVIFVSGESEISEAISALKAGAAEFLLKPVSGSQLVAAVQAVLNQSLHAADSALPPGFERLSVRESQVLELVVKGLRSQKIAENLGITLRTVKMHRGNIMAKVGVQNVAQLVSLYQQQRFTMAPRRPETSSLPS